MRESLEKVREHIARYQHERPVYREMLGFYGMVREEQDRIRTRLKVESFDLDKEPMTSRRQGKVPLLERREFSIDLEATKELFAALCRISHETTPKMKGEIPKIEEAVETRKLNVEDILAKHYDGDYLAQEAERWGLDRGILFFLVRVSVRPCLEAHMEHLCAAVDLETWLQRRCPICGSSPQMAELRDEGGKRYLQCSFCGCQWRWQRLACPYCDNRDFDSLHYFFSEEEEAYRVDLCDQCRGYIKTVDSRKLEYEPDLDLEDVVTIHLDILAVERGYQRPVLTAWGPLTVM